MKKRRKNPAGSRSIRRRINEAFDQMLAWKGSMDPEDWDDFERYCKQSREVVLTYVKNLEEVAANRRAAKDVF